MELIPAASRQLKTYSTWIAIATGIFDVLYISVEALRDQIEPHVFAYINVSLIALIKIASVIKQNIALTEGQKTDIIETATQAPTKPEKEIK